MARRNRNQSDGVVTTNSLTDETHEERLEREEREREEAVERNRAASDYDDPVLADRQRNLYGTLDSNEDRVPKEERKKAKNKE